MTNNLLVLGNVQIYEMKIKNYIELCPLFAFARWRHCVNV